MQPADVQRWFATYLDTYAACGRREEDPERLIDHYAVPLLLTSDAGAHWLATPQDVVGAVRRQVDGMAADAYDHSDVLEAEVEVLNATTARYRGRFARVRADGSEIGRLRATYLIVDGEEGRRIAALVVETA